MTRLWPKAKISTIIFYLSAVTIVSALCNIWYRGGLTSSQILTADIIGKIEISSIKELEVSTGNTLYQLPPDQYQNVIRSIGNLKSAEGFSRKEQSETTCSVSISLKNNNQIIILVKRKNSQAAETVFIEMQEEDERRYSKNTYMAKNLCYKILNADTKN